MGRRPVEDTPEERRRLVDMLRRVEGRPPLDAPPRRTRARLPLLAAALAAALVLAVGRLWDAMSWGEVGGVAAVAALVAGAIVVWQSERSER